MAIEVVLQDSPSPGMSPRISFSYDVSSNDTVPIEQYIRSNSSSIDFDFCVFRETFDQESSSADELFLNGKILPIEIKKRLSPPPPPPPLKPSLSQVQEIPRKAQKSPESDQDKQINTSKPSSSFWRFKRSSSLNCGSGYARTLCPLPLLSRSNSTGSTASTVKRSSLNGNNNNSNQRQHLLKSSYPNSSLKQQSASNGRNHQKPPLKKQSTNAWSGNGVKISPVLNVHSANMFGLGYIFSGGKDKNKKK